MNEHEIPNSADAWTQHAFRQIAFEHAFGGPIDTGGRAAVALRFDHGLVNFARDVLPLTIARGLTVSQAHNPRTLELRENRGVSMHEMDDWVRLGYVEIWNHSSTHRKIETPDDVVDEIISAVAEIEDQLPSASGAVWGFNPPGVPGHDYGGFGKGSRPEEWTTEVGRSILAHHAVASGHLPGTIQRVLDGRVRDGLTHLTLDARPLEDVLRRIDMAVRRRRGLQLMLHPSRIGMDGKIDLERFTAILDHLVERRERGDLVILSPYELLLADSTHRPLA